MDNQQPSFWKKLEECELFEINNKGVIRSIQTKKPRKLVKIHGYLGVAFYNKNWKKRNISKYTQYLVHRLVAKYFIPNPENKPQVNHKNGNKKLNDVSNLEWCTQKENMQHASKILNSQNGENHHNVVLSKKQVLEICEKVKTVSNKKLAKEYNVSKSCIDGIVYGLKWKSVTKNIPHIPFSRKRFNDQNESS